MWHSCPLWNPPSHWYQCCITCRTTRKDRHSGSTPLPICLDCTIDAQVFFSNFFCSVCHVEKLITTSINDSWARDMPLSHMEPIISHDSFIRLRKLFDVFTCKLLIEKVLFPHHSRYRRFNCGRWEGSELRLTKKKKPPECSMFCLLDHGMCLLLFSVKLWRNSLWRRMSKTLDCHVI